MKYTLIALGVLVVIGVGLTMFGPQAEAPESAVYVEPVISWQYASQAEVDGIPYTHVTAVIDGTEYAVGAFTGSCSEIGESGGVDGKGLLAGELSATQCWFAGGGNEVGVFAHEDGGYQILVGELGEGEEGAGLFRGNFEIKIDISPVE